MELAKILSDGTIDLRYCSPTNGSRVTELRNAGFLDFVASDPPKCDVGYITKDSFAIVDGKVVQSWETKIDPETIKAQIDELKQQLSATDYKVIKYYEFVIADDNCEAYADYEMKKLHEERQAIRAEINRLEAML